MRESEILELNTLLKRYKEHLCLLYKKHGPRPHCVACREIKYDKYKDMYVCGVENFTDNFREEIEEDIVFPEQEG